MRPGQNNNNKRMRGRSNNGHSGGRKGPNPLTRSFESNGPDVKIRGTAQHIAEKYLQLARDAQSSGDPVMAESYLQHAEHYYRVIAAAQAAQQQAMGFAPRPQQEIEEEDDGGEEDDRFASVADRLPQPPQAQQPSFPAQPQGGAPQQQGQQPYQGQPNSGFSERQPYQGGQQRPWRDNNRQDGRQDGRQENRQENRPDNRQDGRPDRGEQRFDNRENPRGDSVRSEGGERQERPWRNEPRRAPPRSEAPEPTDVGTALPAFITGSRPAPEAAPEAAPAEPEANGAMDNGEGGFHLRPRRRRRGRPAGSDQFGEEQESLLPQQDTVPVTD